MPKRTDAARAAWLNERLALSFIRTSRTWIDDDLLSALLVAGVLSSNVEPAGATTSDVTESGALSDDLRRPVNAMSVAQSLGMADETARSKLAALVRKGTLQKQGDGLILSAATVSSPPLGQAMGAFGAAVAQFVAGLSNARVYEMETRELAPLNPVLGGLAVRLCTAHILRWIEHARSLNPSIGLPGLYVLLSLGHAVGGSLRLPATHSRVADGLSPTPGMEAVTIASVARVTGLPHETLRRHALKLQALGLVTREGHRCDLALENPAVTKDWAALRDQTGARCEHLVTKLGLAGIVVERDRAA